MDPVESVKDPVTATRHKRLAEIEEQHPHIKAPGYWDVVSENCTQWARELSVQNFWLNVGRQAPTWDGEFKSSFNGGSLLARPLESFVGKSAASIKSKVLRHANVGFNDAGDYPVPKLNDLIRTRVICAYLDGVEFFANKLELMGKDAGITIERNRQGRTEGYFAQHCYFEECVLFRIGGSTNSTKVKCEIQIATQLSTRVWEASHDLYEKHRENKQRAEDWQWNPQDPRFIAHQLGHMIHLADGLIVQLRNTGAKTDE